MAAERKHEKLILHHSNLLQPSDYLRFIHFKGFTSDRKDIGLKDADLQVL